MEFVIADGTAVWRSNRVFSNAKPLEPDDTPSRGRPNALEELPALRPYARVNFVAGVQDLGDIHTTQSGANVQRITIRDSSGTATLNAWGKHVDALSVGKFYQFSNMMVKEFGGANTLTTPKHDASIEPTADVDGIEIAPVSSRAPVTVADAAVRSVTDFTSKLMCPACSHGHLVVSMEEPGMGTCSACPTKAKLSKCKRRRVTAILHVDVDDTSTLQLTADGPVLMKIAEVDDQTKITQFNIINCSSFSLIYNDQTSAIIDVSRPRKSSVPTPFRASGVATAAGKSVAAVAVSNKSNAADAAVATSEKSDASAASPTEMADSPGWVPYEGEEERSLAADYD